MFRQETLMLRYLHFLANTSIQLAAVQFILDSVVTELAKDPNKR